MNTPLPPIPAKRYFTIGEVAELCDVKPHVLRYWEQEFTQLRPMKRRGNRRYYQHHEVLMIRRIRELLYGQGFTISGARTRLQSWSTSEIEADQAARSTNMSQSLSASNPAAEIGRNLTENALNALAIEETSAQKVSTAPLQQALLANGIDIRAELIQIHELLSQTTSKYGL